MNQQVNRIFPTWEHINSFKTPLTPGELRLAQFLDQTLPIGWEIFVQPFLNGDRPDLAILNPKVGLMIFEVKDWQPGLYHTREKTISENGKPSKIKQYYVTDNRGINAIPSPLAQLERYRANLINLYLPQVGEEIDFNPKNLSAFRIGLYFHNMSTAQARQLVHIRPVTCSVFGIDWLDQDHLSELVPDWDRKVSLSMKPDWEKDIRFWLLPPKHMLEMGQTIRLTDEQKRHVEPAPHQHQRLRGVAGSGKTLVVAHRAARLAEQGKRVLVVTYNITLWHYIRDFISNAPHRFPWDLIEFTHFHGFCRNYLSENNIPWPTGDSDDAGLAMAPQMVLEGMQAGKNAKSRSYDAILVDEGQDFEKLWYQTLCEFLTENDELLFVADERQNIYRRDISWIDSMEGTRFRGRWRELKASYRLSKTLAEKANLFAATYLGQEGIALEPAPNDLFSSMEPHLVWDNLKGNEILQWKSRIEQAFEFLTHTQTIHPQDIVILVPTHEDGWELVRMFKAKGVETNHVFKDEKKKHHHKKSFWMGDSRLKVSTIHSFKGWELLNVILLTSVSARPDDDSLDRVIYTAVTRSRQNLMIFNRHARYISFGEAWPHNWDDRSAKE